MAAKNTSKAKKLEEEIEKAHSELQLMHGMKVIRDKIHRDKIKKEQEKIEKLITDNELRCMEIQELKKELARK